MNQLLLYILIAAMPLIGVVAGVTIVIPVLGKLRSIFSTVDRDGKTDEYNPQTREF